MPTRSRIYHCLALHTSKRFYQSPSFRTRPPSQGPSRKAGGEGEFQKGWQSQITTCPLQKNQKRRAPDPTWDSGCGVGAPAPPHNKLDKVADKRSLGGAREKKVAEGPEPRRLPKEAKPEGSPVPSPCWILRADPLPLDLQGVLSSVAFFRAERRGRRLESGAARNLLLGIQDVPMSRQNKSPELPELHCEAACVRWN